MFEWCLGGGVDAQLTLVVMAPPSLRCICAVEEEPETETSHGGNSGV